MTTLILRHGIYLSPIRISGCAGERQRYEAAAPQCPSTPDATDTATAQPRNEPIIPTPLSCRSAPPRPVAAAAGPPSPRPPDRTPRSTVPPALLPSGCRT